MYCWQPSLALDPAKRPFYKRISALQSAHRPRSPKLVAFVADLLARYPDPTETEDTVWADDQPEPDLSAPDRRGLLDSLSFSGSYHHRAPSARHSLNHVDLFGEGDHLAAQACSGRMALVLGQPRTARAVGHVDPEPVPHRRTHTAITVLLAQCLVAPALRDIGLHQREKHGVTVGRINGEQHPPARGEVLLDLLGRLGVAGCRRRNLSQDRGIQPK
jgi:hypothetical protein